MNNIANVSGHSLVRWCPIFNQEDIIIILTFLIKRCLQIFNEEDILINNNNNNYHFFSSNNKTTFTGITNAGTLRTFYSNVLGYVNVPSAAFIFICNNAMHTLKQLFQFQIKFGHLSPFSSVFVLRIDIAEFKYFLCRIVKATNGCR